jgi:hypothetical protein
MKRLLHGRGARAAGLVLVGALLASAALAAEPFFSGPSMTKPAAATTFSGQGFAPNAALTVMVRAPDGSTAGYSAVAAADGSFAYTLTPSMSGAYTITVTDSSGKALASATVAAMP